MAAHGGPLDSLCRHPLLLSEHAPGQASDTSTISAVVLLPSGLRVDSRPALLLAAGQPCEVAWLEIEVA